MTLNELVRDGEAEPGAIVLRREERIENVAPRVLRQTSPLVGDANFELAVLSRNTDLETATIRHSLDAIQHDVEKRLLELPGVGGNLRQSALRVYVDHGACTASLLRAQRLDGADDVFHAARLAIGRRRSCELKELVENAVQPVELLLEDV